MEDALAHALLLAYQTPRVAVLILVLMEDALAPITIWILAPKRRCLNPCFNGRCTRTAKLG